MEQTGNRSTNVFLGKDGPYRFLTQLETPLVEMPDELNPFREQKVHFALKLQYASGLSNGKFIGAAGILEAAQAGGELKGKRVCVDGTSGNFGLQMAVLCHHIGMGFIAVVGANTPAEKTMAMELAGVQIVRASEGENTIQVAKDLAQQHGDMFCSMQYDNPENLLASMEVARQIDEQSERRVTAVSIALGSGGTGCGVSYYFRKYATTRKIYCQGVAPDESGAGARNFDDLEKSGLARTHMHMLELRQVSAKKSMQLAPGFLENGIWCGKTSLEAIQGAFDDTADRIDSGRLDHLRDVYGEVWWAVILMDSAWPYLAEFSKILKG